ncbi:unnamed protein product [Clonostachys solani]|uniref:Uncharacterized protein n=1 Tax=Clonostachys solani TaxID=160281 RepID=A0A9P0EN40_9HYPO|nr:unnamed protein product [Clonostachys solani]
MDLNKYWMRFRFYSSDDTQPDFNCDNSELDSDCDNSEAELESDSLEPGPENSSSKPDREAVRWVPGRIPLEEVPPDPECGTRVAARLTWVHEPDTRSVPETEFVSNVRYKMSQHRHRKDDRLPGASKPQ